MQGMGQVRACVVVSSLNSMDRCIFQRTADDLCLGNSVHSARSARRASEGREGDVQHGRGDWRNSTETTGHQVPTAGKGEVLCMRPLTLAGSTRDVSAFIDGGHPTWVSARTQDARGRRCRRGQAHCAQCLRRP
jgi:hypothetical protein